MATEERSFQRRLVFSELDRLPGDMYWINQPTPPHQLVPEGAPRNAGLHVTPSLSSDLWQKTFYSPLLVKTDAPALLLRVPNTLKEWSAELHFTLERAAHQFDQAGLLVFCDEKRSLKAGIEMVDGEPRMSCVVTNGYSDWSVRPWRSAAAAIRVSHVRGSLAVECRDEDGRWSFYRIAPSMVADGNNVGVGMVCCSPKETGMTAIFHSFSTSDTVTFEHHS